MKRLSATRWRLLALGVVASVAIVAASVYGYGALAGNTPQSYTGCLLGGKLTNIVIDGTGTTPTCPKPGALINWSQTGPTGATGQDGPTGATGATGPTGPSDGFAAIRGNFNSQNVSTDQFNPTIVRSLSLSAGSYVLNASVAFAAEGPAAGTGIHCDVYTGSTFLGTDFQDSLAPSPSLSFLVLPITSAFTLAAPTDVSIRCSAFGSPVQTQQSTITAIRVGSLTIG